MGAIRISKAKVKYTDNSHLYGVLVEPINSVEARERFGYTGRGFL